MLVPVCGADSDAAGRLVTYHRGRFILKGDSAISGARGPTCDELELLEWAHPSLR
jgi:hypothetical protein